MRVHTYIPRHDKLLVAVGMAVVELFSADDYGSLTS
jgi:hypothetical protein